MEPRSIQIGSEVALLEDLPSHGLVRGQVGRVQAETEAGVFQVEFVQADGTSCTTVTLRALGIRVLHNEHVVLREDDGAFVLASVPDWTGGGFGAAHQPRLGDALAGREPTLPVMLLAHQPRQFPEAARQGVALQLSGHTHGGQIWPFTLLVALVERYVAGLHREGSSQLYVSRGTRYWGPPMRLGAPHELTVLQLRAD